MHTIIIGAGFGGLRAMSELAKDPSQQITIIDRHDYNFFPPLIYQVAAGFLSPSDISYPIRKFISKMDNVRYRKGILQSVDTKNNILYLDNGELSYDRLILAIGSEPNYFGNTNIEKFAFPMKRISDALTIRNRLLDQFNHAATLPKKERLPYQRIVIAGGGPSGVELAGVLAEIRHDIFEKEYPEFDTSSAAGIELITADPVLLTPMSKKSQQYAKDELENYGVKLIFSDPVKDYDGSTITLCSGKKIKAKTLIWTAGVICQHIDGFNDHDFARGKRLLVDNHLKLVNYENIYALGDMALCHSDPNYPDGHPQLGQVAMSQGLYLGKNLRKSTKEPYIYKHRGDMAMVGRLKAVAEIKKYSFDGFIAWVTWVWIHIIALSTNKNRIATTYNWMISFFTRNQSMRMKISSKSAEEYQARNPFQKGN